MIQADTEIEPRRRAIRAGGHNDGVGKTVGDFVLTERIRSETEEAFFREVVALYTHLDSRTVVRESRHLQARVDDPADITVDDIKQYL
jgi:hypothetical protein